MSQQTLIDPSHEIKESPELLEIDAGEELLELPSSKNMLELDADGYDKYLEQLDEGLYKSQSQLEHEVELELPEKALV